MGKSWFNSLSGSRIIYGTEGQRRILISAKVFSNDIALFSSGTALKVSIKAHGVDTRPKGSRASPCAFFGGVKPGQIKYYKHIVLPPAV
jgi:hypothetical protein